MVRTQYCITRWTQPRTAWPDGQNPVLYNQMDTTQDEHNLELHNLNHSVRFMRLFMFRFNKNLNFNLIGTTQNCVTRWTHPKLQDHMRLKFRILILYISISHHRITQYWKIPELIGSEWDNNRKHGNQVATNFLPSSEIFVRNLSILKYIY